jgi:hypothetical protein
MPPIPQLEKAAPSLPTEPSLCAVTDDGVATPTFGQLPAARGAARPWRRGAGGPLWPC